MKVTVGKIKKRKIILLNFVILLFDAYWLGVFFIFYSFYKEYFFFVAIYLVYPGFVFKFLVCSCV